MKSGFRARAGAQCDARRSEDRGSLPGISLFIAGAARSGTSTLLATLGLHSQVRVHTNREFTYFNNAEEYRRGYNVALQRYFHDTTDGLLVAKNAGLMYSDAGLRRLQSHGPRGPVVILLRNPADRAYSLYWYAKSRGWESAESFEQAIERGTVAYKGKPAPIQARHYVTDGIYAPQIALISDLFPDNLRVLTLESFVNEPTETAEALWGELGLDSCQFTELPRLNRTTRPRSRAVARFIGANSRWKLLPRKLVADRLLDSVKSRLVRGTSAAFYRPPMRAETRDRLADLYRPYIEQLEEILGRELTEWA